MRLVKSMTVGLLASALVLAVPAKAAGPQDPTRADQDRAQADDSRKDRLDYDHDKDKNKDVDKDDAAKIQEYLQDAQQVLTSALEAPDKGIPRDLLSKAECVGVFPGVKKGAFIVGGKFGRGVVTCRTSDGQMSAPAFFTIGGGSFGWQFGGESVDLVMLVMNDKGMDKLLEDKFTLGAEASAVAGPVGRTASAATDAQLRAGILTWSRSKGAFLGASLEGAGVHQNKGMNKDLYGKDLTAKDILRDHKVPSVPSVAQPFISKTTEVMKRGS